MENCNQNNVKSFLVLFPEEAEVIERSAEVIAEEHWPGPGLRRPGVHLTLHYFRADGDTCCRLVAAIDSLVPALLPVTLNLEQTRRVNIPQSNSSWVSWVCEVEGDLLALRRGLEQPLIACGIHLEDINKWQPHITIKEDIPLDNAAMDRIVSKKLPPLNVKFNILKLTRWHGGMNFEIVKEWKLSAK
jgi:hypothetical protein